MVRWDVINDKVSPESARANYKVVLDDSMNVDRQATKSLRNEFRKERR
jgi:hypothetical protein